MLGIARGYFDLPSLLRMASRRGNSLRRAKPGRFPNSNYSAPFFRVLFARPCAGVRGWPGVRRRAARRRDFVILGDSATNCEDLVALGAEREHCRVLPPLHFTEELGGAPFSSAVLERYGGKGARVLFVGGIKPNKGHRVPWVPLRNTITTEIPLGG